MERQAFATDITRAQFELVRPLLEGARKRTRPRRHDLYDVFCAVLYFEGTGAPWRSLPPAFPPWRTVHEYYSQWSQAPEGRQSLLEQAMAILKA